MPARLTIRLPGRVAAARAVAAPADSAPATAAAVAAAAEAPGPDAGKHLEAERMQLQQARQALLDAAGKFQQSQQQFLRQAETQLLDLAVDIARKILMREIEAGRYEIEPIVKEALRRIPAHQDVVVHLHPDDWSRCQSAQPSEAPPGSAHVRFVSDAGVRRAECLIEGPEGVVESAVETQLGEIAQGLKALE